MDKYGKVCGAKFSDLSKPERDDARQGHANFQQKIMGDDKCRIIQMMTRKIYAPLLILISNRKQS